jgi:hypothetical protein
VTKKNGVSGKKQVYKCYQCKRQFRGGELLNARLIWEQYVEGKQTYWQLAKYYECSIRTIQRKIDQALVERQTEFSSKVNLLMDTTYFGRNLGVMVFKDSLSGRVLYKQYVKTETNALYLLGIKEITRRGIEIKSIICDGRKGLMTLASEIPIQICQFHQVAIVRRYLTKKPKMQASKELWEHTLLLKATDKESFVGGLDQWYTKWQAFLNEQSIDDKGKKKYVHKKLRSAYRSLKTNMPWLFTWYDNMELKMPNTTNAIDGHFASLKNKLRNHNGLSIKRKMKFIDEFFKA